MSDGIGNHSVIASVSALNEAKNKERKKRISDRFFNNTDHGVDYIEDALSNPLVSTKTTPNFTPFSNKETKESKYDNPQPSTSVTPVTPVNKQGIKVVSTKTKKEYTVYITGDTIDIVDNENKTHTMKRIRSQQGVFKKNKRPTKKSKRIQ